MKKTSLYLLLTIVSLAGCYSPAPNIYKSEKTQEVDFKNYKTFAWFHTKDTAYTKMAEKAKVEKALAYAVRQQLESRGMVMDTVNPDCLFTYALVLNQTYQVGQGAPDVYTPQYNTGPAPGQYNMYYYQPYNQPQAYIYDANSYGGSLQVTTFRDGSLVIDMIDRKENKIIWRTSAQGKVDEKAAKGVRPTINEIVPIMFKKFPVKK